MEDYVSLGPAPAPGGAVWHEAVANELQLDLSEGMLFRLRDEAESETVRIRAAEFHLNKKGRRRGYGDRMDVTSADEKLETFIVTINHPDKPD